MKERIQFYIWLCSCVFSIPVFGQTQIAGNILTERGEHLPYVNVVLLSIADSSFLAGDVSDEEGHFTIPLESFNVAILKCSSIGFEEYFEKITHVESKLKIVMKESSVQLEEVVVSQRKMLYEQKSDRLVFNVGSIPSMQGDNGLQILQKSPGVRVDQISNTIDLNGKGDATVMINGRISRMSGDALFSLLQGMQGSNIEKIEVIHQPGAKYEANNAAGIIHLVLKENTMVGWNGKVSLTAGYGQREKGNGNAQFNYRKGGLNVYGNISGSQSRSPIWKINHAREYRSLNTNYFYENQLVFTNPINWNYGGQFGIDLDVNESTTIGLLAGGTKGDWGGNDFTSESNFFENEVPVESTSNIIDGNNPSSNYYLNLNVFKRINARSTLNFDVDRVQLDVDNLTYLRSLEISNNDGLYADRNTGFTIYTFQTDYELTNQNEWTFQLGGKGSFNNSNTQSEVREVIDNESVQWDQFFQRDVLDEMLLAAYGSVKKSFNAHWSGEFGLRYENYKYTLQSIDNEDDLNVDFNNLFPVLNASYQIDSFQSLQFGFTRRTTRATFSQLAGYFAFIDPSLLATSNTSIRPSFTNNMRLGYQVRSFIFSIEANRTNGPIAFLNFVDKERDLQTSIPTNFDQMDMLIASVNFPVRPTTWWEMNWDIRSSYTQIADLSNRSVAFEHDLISFTAQMNSTFELGKSWLANVDGRYMSPFLSGDQRQHLRPYINFGIQKKFKNGSQIGFSVQDISRSSGKINWEYNQPALEVRTFGNNDWSERVYRITYSFNFGDKSIKSKRDRKTSSEEERGRM